MDVQAAKEAIVRELSNRIALSGGMEVFRRLVGGRSDVIQEALGELVTDGLLKRTDLRVGVIYHYPPNEKSSMGMMLRAISGAPAPAARPAVAPPPRPAVPTPPAVAAAAPPSEAPAVPAEHSGPVRAKKKTDMSPEELAAVEARRAAILASRGVAPGAPATADADPAPAPVAPAAFSGPVRAKKRSEMTPEELEAAEAARAAAVAAREAGAAASPAAAPTAALAPPAEFSGPVRAKKKSEMTPEEPAAAEAQLQAVMAARAAAPPAPPVITPSPSTAVAPAASTPAAYTGPVRAKKKSEMTPEELAAAEAQLQAVLAARAAGEVPGTGPSPAAPAQEAVASDETSETAVTSADVVEQREAAAPSPEAPKVYTGPVRAKKKSEGG